MKAFNHVNAKFLAEAGAALADGKTTLIAGGSPRICLNAVAPRPYRAVKAEAAIAGRPINEANAEAAGEAAVADARPLQATRYKVQIAKTLVKRALLATV